MEQGFESGSAASTLKVLSPVPELSCMGETKQLTNIPSLRKAIVEGTNLKLTALAECELTF